jgi:hypothetical protein
MTNYELVRQWMRDNAADYDDGIDINCTKLAEDAAYQFDIYECDEDTVPDDTYPIPEWVYEMAVEVEAWYLAPEPYWYEETDDEDESEDW